MNNIRGFAEAERRWLEDDREEPKEVATCQCCGEELYEGDNVIIVNGDYLCDSSDCLVGYLDAKFVEAKEDTVCEHCNHTIEAGEEVYEIDGNYVCDDFDCLLGYCDADRTTAESEEW